MNLRWSASNLTTPGGQTALALPGALALTGLVTAVVVFFTAQDDERAFGLGIGLGLGGFVLFAAVTALVAVRTRARVALGWTGDALRLDVTPPGKPTVSYAGPFRVEVGYVRDSVATGRGGSLPQLTLLVAVKEAASGRCVLYLRELLGAIYEPPAGWPARMVVVAGSEHVLVNSIGRTHLDELAKALA